MNPEYLLAPIVRFEASGEHGKLVRDGVYMRMLENGERPEVAEITDRTDRDKLIRAKVFEELTEFEQAEDRSAQISEAADFLEACNLFIEHEVLVNQRDSKRIGRFQRLMHERQITVNEAEINRRRKAASDGTYKFFKPVKAVTVRSDSPRLSLYTTSHWRRASSYFGVFND